MNFNIESGMVATIISVGVVFLTDQIKDKFIKDKVFVRTVDLPEVIKTYKIVTTDVCATLHNEIIEEIKKENENQLNEGFENILKKLEDVTRTNKAILMFLAGRCQDKDEFKELMKVSGD